LGLAPTVTQMQPSSGAGRFRGVLFDFGHTLFGHDPLRVTIANCARRLGAPLSEEKAAALADRIDTAAMTPDELAHRRDLDAVVWKQRWDVLYGIADECVIGLGDAVNVAMHDPFSWTPYRRSGATLRSLHAHGLAVGIVANTGWDVRRAFSAHSMYGSVTSFTLSYEVGATKPDRQIFDAACESLGLAPEELVMVGDDPRADSGAVTAGIRTLLLPALPPHADNGVGAVIDLVGIRD
jgi:FMN phosphatase YigB (HAD superfamily)